MDDRRLSKFYLDLPPGTVLESHYGKVVRVRAMVGDLASLEPLRNDGKRDGRGLLRTGQLLVSNWKVKTA